MKIFFKQFLITFFPFTLFMIILFSFRTKFSVAIIQGLISGIVFGVGMSILLTILRIYSRKKPMSDKANKNSGVKQVRNFEIFDQYNSVFDQCVSSITNIRKGKIEKADKKNGEITARVGMNLKTFGEVIEFKLTESSEGATNIILSSKPILATVVFDYNKNRDNVDKILFYLSQHYGLKQRLIDI